MKKIKKILFTTAIMAGTLMSFVVSAAEESPAADQDSAKGGLLGGFLPIIAMYALLFGAMYFILIRPQRKRQKKEDELRNSVILGDNITTIGGVTGRVVQIKDDEITIESSIDRTLLTFKKWAIRDVQKLETDDEEK
ncbi:MAG TPA: preprotein translocase subunit YajC [Clostridia bacterium]|jgi:preprotein translocase subunit YajC|nr:preprotein translocase subunit YajC [Clostridia bacterium]HPZ51898.1 preprotein translocase subunit YajC [Clostridia bacterium]